MMEYNFCEFAVTYNFTKVALRCRYAPGYFPNFFRTGFSQNNTERPLSYTSFHILKITVSVTESASIVDQNGLYQIHL